MEHLKKHWFAWVLFVAYTILLIYALTALRVFLLSVTADENVLFFSTVVNCIAIISLIILFFFIRNGD